MSAPRCSPEGESGRRRGAPYRSGSCRLGCGCAVDVLVEPARVGTRVAGEAAVAVLGAALVDVGAVAVAVACLTRVRPRNDVSPVGPRAERERSDRADV